MFSVKPGRGPSLAGAVGSLFVAGFGVVWMIGAASIGAPGFFVAFGVIFVIFALVGGAFSLYNATAKNRFSSLDIVDPAREPDPLDPHYRDHQHSTASHRDEHPTQAGPTRFCTTCGSKLAADFAFCPGCGKAVQASDEL